MGWINLDTLIPTLYPEKEYVGKQVSGENEQKLQKKYAEAIKKCSGY